jgi:rod shape-determining protein MreD
MIGTSEPLLASRKKGFSPFRMRPFAILLFPFLGVLYQSYVPQFLEQLGYLELPLLVVLYFSLTWRSQVRGLFYGSVVGLLQDLLAERDHPIGLFGIVKTLVGYFAASVSQRFDVDNSAIRFILVFFFYVFHRMFYWMMARALLGIAEPLESAQTFIVAGLNAAVAVPLFLVFDKMKERM